MSLRLRLILLTVALVTVVVVVLSGLYLNSLVDSLSATALDRAQLASQQVNAYLNDRINRNSPDASSGKPTRTSSSAAEFRRNQRIVARDCGQRSGYCRDAVPHHGAVGGAGGNQRGGAGRQ